MNLISWAGKRLKAVEAQVNPFDKGATYNTVMQNRQPVPNQGSLAQKIVAQVNPADQGRTFNTVAQRGPTYAPNPASSAIQQIIHSAPVRIATGLASPATNLIRTDIVNPLRVTAAQISHNPVALRNANIAQDQSLRSLGGFAQSVARTVPETLTTVTHPFSQFTYTPGSRIEKGLFGSTPVQNIQKKVATTYTRNAGKPLPVRLGLAAGEAAGSVLQDLPVAYGATKLVSRTAKTAGIPKPSNLSPTEVGNLTTYHQQMGTGKFMDQGVYNKGVAAAKKAGIPHTDSNAIGNLLNQHLNYQTQLLNRQQQLNKLNVGRLGLSTRNIPAPEGAKASVSLKDQQARSLSESPKVSPQEVLPATTPKNAQLKPLGSKSAIPAPESPQAKSLIKSEQPQIEQSALPPNYTPTRGFIQSVNKSPEVSPTVAKRASGTYQVRSTPQLAQKADQFASGNLGKATERVQSALQVKTGAISDRDVANAIAVAKRLDANKNFAQATDIYERTAEHLTAQGQSIQAASLLDRRTPEGLRYQITKTFKKAGVEPTQDTLNKIDSKIGEIKKTQSGTPERILATKQLQKMVADQLPSNFSDKAISFWKAGLLTGLRTQSGNILSNEMFSILHNLSNPLASGLDVLTSLKTGVRTKTLTTRGLASGTKEGARRGFGKQGYLRTGIDERTTMTNKFEGRQVNFKNKALNTYVNGVFRLMGAADRPHYYRQLQNSLYDLAKTDTKNKGLSGSASRDYVKQFVQDPPQNAFQLATNEAEKSVLAHDTVLYKAISKLRQAAEDAESPLGKAVTEASINLLMPFTKVPSAFISRVVDFTPVGAIKTIASQISRGVFDQRAFVTAISEATTGTGVMYLGMKLAEKGMLSGDYPTDPKEQQRWKAEGIQPNSVKIGGQWLNMNYAGPIGLLFGMGGRMADTKQKGGSWIQQQAQAYAGLPKSLMQQSFLQGLSGALQAVNEPGRYASNYVKTQAGSIIPNLLSDVAIATDTMQRQVNNVGQAIKTRIPGLRESLNPAQDVYGNPLPRKTNPVGTMVNPLRPTPDMSNKNPVVQEVNRLHNVDPSNNDLQVTPVPIKQNIKVEGKDLKLNDKQRYDLQTTVGQAIQSNWGNLINTPQYQAMSDIEKAQALSNLRTDTTTLIERAFVTQNQLGAYQKPATKNLIKLAQGDLSQYLGVKSSKTSTKTTKTTTPKTTKARTARGSSRPTGKASLSKILSTLKSTNAAIKPPTPPKVALKTPTKYKAPAIKKYTPTRQAIARGGKISVRRGIV